MSKQTDLNGHGPPDEEAPDEDEQVREESEASDDEGGITASVVAPLAAGALGSRRLVMAILHRLGLTEDSFLVVLAIFIGVVTGAAAVAFHELIDQIRNLLYERLDPRVDLYGSGLILLAFLPALGGLAVGLIGRYVVRTRAGHGVVDVMESIVRTQGFVRPRAAVEKILTSALTIGSGGSAGAEGPIIQIGAGIASGVGQVFRVARRHMPILVGCGSAAGISAIFNAPIGGVLFTLEVLLQDYSLRTFTPIVFASVIANVTTNAIFRMFLERTEQREAIFAIPWHDIVSQAAVTWGQLPLFLVLGLLCGVAGVALTRLMYATEKWFHHTPLPRAVRPAVGGLALGVLGVWYVVLFGWVLLDQAKPFPFHQYPMPAFFGDGYGVVRQLLTTGFYGLYPPHVLFLLLGFLCLIKIVGTCLTLASGGSGGVIAPSVFLGATAGGLLGVILRETGTFDSLQPNIYALVGMGAVLAAVVHAPLASILIVFELTQDPKIVLPAMLACVVATGFARLLFRDSVYTLSLRLRGVRVGTASDFLLLRRLHVEQVSLEPAVVLRDTDPLQRALDLVTASNVTDFIVTDKRGNYVGLLTAEDIKTALLDREAVPLLLVNEVMRTNVATVRSSDNLAAVLDTFSLHDVSRLPVTLANGSGQIIGLISRAALMKRYQQALAET